MQCSGCCIFGPLGSVSQRYGSVLKCHGSGTLPVWENFNIFFLFSSSDSQCLRGKKNRGAGEYGTQYRWNHQVTLRPDSGSSDFVTRMLDPDPALEQGRICLHLEAVMWIRICMDSHWFWSAESGTESKRAKVTHKSRKSEENHVWSAGCSLSEG